METPFYITAIVLAIGLSNPSLAQQVDSHKDSGVPSLEISSKTKYTHEYIDILGSKMAYIDVGEGDPILFLHGQPTSSYLWRNVMPHLESQGRLIALDNIGFGKSDQPELDYTFGDQYPYFEDFVRKMKLENITLVVHDWGSGLGLHYASRHESNIKAIVTMESLMAPLLPAKTWDDYPKHKAEFSKIIRSEDVGRRMVIKENWFLEKGIQFGTVRKLDKEARDVYREPFPTEESRIQVYQWPKELPINGEPAETVKVISDYNAWLEKTEIPWLYLYATPGSQNPPEAADYWEKRAKNIQVTYIGSGIHYVQEDQPYAIGRAIHDWYRRLEASNASTTGAKQAKTRVLASYPSGTFLENLEAQTDGRLLFTDYPGKTIEQLSPEGKASTFATLSAYPLGIISTPDGYLVTANGKSVLLGEDASQSQQLLLLNEKGKQIGKFDAPQARALNGMVRLDNDTILAADSAAGTIWKVDVEKQEITLWIQDKYLSPIADQEVYKPGANGLKMHPDGLLVSNTSLGTLSLIKVDKDGKPASKPEVIAKVGMIDDFWVKDDGSIIFTTHEASIKSLSADGDIKVVATQDLLGNTAIAPYPPNQSESFAVTTDGGLYFGSKESAKLVLVTPATSPKAP